MAYYKKGGPPYERQMDRVDRPYERPMDRVDRSYRIDRPQYSNRQMDRPQYSHFDRPQYSQVDRPQYVQYDRSQIERPHYVNHQESRQSNYNQDRYRMVREARSQSVLPNYSSNDYGEYRESDHVSTNYRDGYRSTRNNDFLSHYENGRKNYLGLDDHNSEYSPEVPHFDPPRRPIWKTTSMTQMSKNYNEQISAQSSPDNENKLLPGVIREHSKRIEGLLKQSPNRPLNQVPREASNTQILTQEEEGLVGLNGLDEEISKLVLTSKFQLLKDVTHDISRLLNDYHVNPERVNYDLLKQKVQTQMKCLEGLEKSRSNENKRV